MNLLIVRHAIAEEVSRFAKTGKPDSARPLTEAGKEKMRKTAKGLAEIVPGIDVLATSPWERAAETARILSKQFGIKSIELEELTGKDAPSHLLPWLRKQARHETVAIVGHEPYLARLAGWLTTGEEHSILELRKGGACLIKFSEKIEPGKGIFSWLLKPSQLRKCR